MGKDHRPWNPEVRAPSVCPLPLGAEVWAAGPGPSRHSIVFLWANLPGVSCLPPCVRVHPSSQEESGHRLPRPCLWVNSVSTGLPWVGVGCPGPEAREPVVDSAKLLLGEAVLELEHNH